MDPISNVDLLVLQLRRRLQEKTVGKPRAASGPRPGAEPQGMKSVYALAAVRQVSDHQLKRALLQHLLCDFFGEELINDAKFQNVVDQVGQIIDRDPALAKLMARAVSDLRGAAC